MTAVVGAIHQKNWGDVSRDLGELDRRAGLRPGWDPQRAPSDPSPLLGAWAGADRSPHCPGGTARATGQQASCSPPVVLTCPLQREFWGNVFQKSPFWALLGLAFLEAAEILLISTTSLCDLQITVKKLL